MIALSPPARVGVALLVQLALVGAAVAPQLSARVAGEDYLVRVAPLDPIDPFRGAYVDLDYPDLHVPDGSPPPTLDQGDRGTVFIPLEPDGDVWVMTGYTRTRPAAAPYLTCDDHDHQVSCGIESLFLPQDEARALEAAVASGEAVARVRVDGRGHAALIDVEAR